MKRLLLVMLFMFAVGLAGTFAQGAETSNNETTIGFATIASIILLVGVIVEGIKKAFELKSYWYMIISWIISIAVCFIGWYFKLGLFQIIESWYYAALIGVGVGFTTNKFYDIGKLIFIMAGLKPGSDFSIKDYSGYFEKHSEKSFGRFKVLYDHGTASIVPEGGYKYTSIDVK